VSPGDARVVQAAEHADELSGGVAVHDEPPGVRPTVEAAVRHRQHTEIAERDRASRMP
jgi:hypothetical protein